VRPAQRADNSAVLCEPNVKERMEVEDFIPPLSLHDLLQKNFSFYMLKVVGLFEDMNWIKLNLDRVK
jgi:hypothetical protein